MVKNKLELSEKKWYGWQSLDLPYYAGPWNCSPVLITKIQPLKTGKGLLKISLVIALHPRQAVEHAVIVKVALHTRSFLICTVFEEHKSGLPPHFLLTEINFDWLTQFCSKFWERFPLENVGHHLGVDRDVTAYLGAAFGNEVDRIIAGATKDSFKVKVRPMPVKKATIILGKGYDEFDSYLIIRGHIPDVMEDKWFIFAQGGCLHFHRSWTGYCIYQVLFERRGNEIYLGQAYVNRNLKQYSATDDNYDKQQLLYIIDSILLKINPGLKHSNDLPSGGMES